MPVKKPTDDATVPAKRADRYPLQAMCTLAEAASNGDAPRPSVCGCVEKYQHTLRCTKGGQARLGLVHDQLQSV